MEHPTLLIIGHGRAGKDEMAEYWDMKFNFKAKSSSLAAAEIFIYDALKDKYGYKNFDACYRDRHNHRAEWYDLICDYNLYDKTRLAREIVKKTGSYIGMRDREEILACLAQGIFDLVIWVDAGDRIEPEHESSFNITPDLADIIVENKGSLLEYRAKLDRLGLILFKLKFVL